MIKEESMTRKEKIFYNGIIDYLVKSTLILIVMIVSITSLHLLLYKGAIMSTNIIDTIYHVQIQEDVKKLLFAIGLFFLLYVLCAMQSVYSANHKNKASDISIHRILYHLVISIPLVGSSPLLMCYLFIKATKLLIAICGLPQYVM